LIPTENLQQAGKDSIFAKFMKYAGKFLRKLKLRDFFGFF